MSTLWRASADSGWRKSSFSNTGNCVELAWRKSSFSNTGDCLELGWRKSSFSDTGDCVEVTWSAVRDSKNPAGPILHLGPASLSALVAQVRSMPRRPA